MTGSLAERGKDPERISDDRLLETGQWYWVKDGKKEWLGCITRVGSNYAKLETPYGSYDRIHLDKFQEVCRPETSPETYIHGKISHYRGVMRNTLQEIKDITARLGVSTQEHIEHTPSERGLAALSSTADTKQYKKDLIRAKKKQLPKLFEKVEEANENLVTWMKAQMLPMAGAVGNMKSCIAGIEDRIFNVSLYAGLTEDVVQVSKGEPAPRSEKLRLMQRRLYMDEECLLDYRHGGIECKDIGQFDRWLAEPEHRDRILPFPRCIVAFRVRRNTKIRKWDGGLRQALINMDLEKYDELTVLYIRNGDQLYRMDSDLEFGTLIFPGKGEFNLSEPMMISDQWGETKIIPVREYEGMLEDQSKKRAQAKAWAKANPKKDEFHNPHMSMGDSDIEDDWEPFTKDSVHYDDAQGVIADRVKRYNRISLILQGLLDRSDVLHPHPPVQLWKAEDFEGFVELVYDGTDTLAHGDPPDFQAYRKRCNASLKEGCLTVGQEGVFSRKEAEKENARHGWHQNWHNMEHHYPYGNPGPGYLAKVALWHPRVRKATYKWNRERQNYQKGWLSRGKPGDLIPTSITVSDEKLFNVSAYKLGDYKQFFQDPRTRAEYLQWAPMLLMAEEYHVGNLVLGEDGSVSLKKKRKKKRGKRKRG